MANLNYVNYDFDDLVAQLVNRLLTDPSSPWKDTYQSATGQMLINFHAYVGNMLLYYTERTAEELYLETAKNRSSIIRMVRLLNYTPKRKTSSVGILTFTLSSPLTKNVYIPAYTECQNAAGTKFVTTEDVVILAGQSSITANAIQGEKVEIAFTPDGSANYEYNINDVSIENTRMYVYENDIIWTKVTSFFESTPTSLHYKERTELDDTVTILFGDNVRGKIPTGSVLLRYVKSLGLDSNVYSAASITTINSTIYDIDGTPVTTLSVSNAASFLGGDDAENSEEIAYEAPRVFSTGDRAITKEDYEAIIDNYSSVASSNVWGENEESPPDPTMYNKVRLCVLLQNWEDPDTAFKTVLSEYLETKAQITVHYEYITAELLYIIPVVTASIVKGYSLSNADALIETAINGQFTLGDTTKIGNDIHLADIMTAVEAEESVSFHRMYLDIYQELDTDSVYDYAGVLKALTILEGSVKVYVGGVLVATDDGAGNISDPGGGTYTVTGDINYTTGVIGVDFTPEPITTISIRYQQDNNGDISVDKDQICKIQDIEITSSYVS